MLFGNSGVWDKGFIYIAKADSAGKDFRFFLGPSKAKQKPLKLNSKEELTILSLSGTVRKMSDETKDFFDSLFNENI